MILQLVKINILVPRHLLYTYPSGGLSVVVDIIETSINALPHLPAWWKVWVLWRGGEGMEGTNGGEGMEGTNGGEGMEGTNEGEEIERRNEGEGMEAIRGGKRIEGTNGGTRLN